MFKIAIICHDSSLDEAKDYMDTPANDPSFETKTEAWKYAYSLADNEADSLNDGAIKGVSFGIIDDNNPDNICVAYYYDDNTELVTEYIVYEQLTDMTHNEYQNMFKEFEANCPDWSCVTDIITYLEILPKWKEYEYIYNHTREALGLF